MIWMDRLALFTTLDFVAVGFVLVIWWGMTHLIENPPKSRPSMSNLMADYRREWMQQFIHRQPRIYDAQIVGGLRQATAFFGSATLLAIGGALALIGNADQVSGVASDFALMEAPRFVWEIKIVLILVFTTNAFLKFVWSNRLFGYCSIVMSALPVDTTDPLCDLRADQAAQINISAARAFNRGLRSVYFGLAACAWLAGPLALIGTTILTVFVIYRREFASLSRATLLRKL
ncbi:DUF599 domain-containing protein [Cognatishimia activa]|uniref:DUF599 domain-containing protein n=1 Tax=Cognatishimia activa TaxID=1715691 RepID=A0A975ERM3_9RHOB|nr:DUF599 domain-containing protein [Cognatishimia activa]QTN36903.1 DUF599 domain-containing protein [Cognatishimia activa]